jgi:hypothetical protein
MVHTHDILCRDQDYTVHGIHKRMIYYAGSRITQFMVYISMIYYARDQDYTVHGIHKHDILCQDQDYTVHGIHTHDILC